MANKQLCQQGADKPKIQATNEWLLAVPSDGELQMKPVSPTGVLWNIENAANCCVLVFCFFGKVVLMNVKSYIKYTV